MARITTERPDVAGFAAIGLGDHFERSHEPFLKELSSCEIVGVADRDETRLAAVRSRLTLPEVAGFTDHQRLLGSEAVQAVVIATGDSSHFRIASDALRAGKHVLLEKPAAATVQESTQLPGLFDYAEQEGLRFWVCHPREFGDGPWGKAAELIGNPNLISETFGVGSMGNLLEVRYDCHYTLPGDKSELLHTSFADDKMNHNVVSLMKALPNVTGFRNAVMLDNTATSYEARMVTLSEDESQAEVVVRTGGRRSAHKENHGEGVYRDTLVAIFEEGELQVEPSLGTIGLMYGKKPKSPLEFDPNTLYDDMFRAENTAFVEAVLNPQMPEPLTRHAKILGTAAAILMQQSGFNGIITEQTVRQNG